MDAFVNADGISGSISEDAINRTAINTSPGQSLLNSCNQRSILVAKGAPINIAGIPFVLVSTVLVIASVISTIWMVSGVGMVSAEVPRVEATDAGNRSQ